MGACTVAPRPSSHDVRPTSNSVPEQPVAHESLNSGWPAGTPDESNTKTQQPHDAFYMKRRALFTSLWKIWLATILFPANQKLMRNEERRLTCRQTGCVNITHCQSLHWQVRTCQRISKSPALRLRTTHCSNPAHNVNKTIFVICFSFKVTYSTFLATNRTRKVSNTLLVFFHNRRHSRNNTNIWRQTHSRCSFINRQFPLRWTWNILSEKNGHSTLGTSHSHLAQGVANNFKWWIYIFILTNLFISIKKSD